ncbi:hypothetical protein CTI16_10365 [Prevotella intermedia]|uniref:Uncharacterized protein n=1 Tax=Prevotella intermedia TaxID=28131 RepID=A0AAJ3RI04_PREIN|nr:hypothetical protein CUB95_10540 [Prevotella intermedia]PIK17595.1 hypothetical protein CTI16_10365 [Prevotella intermedia]
MALRKRLFWTAKQPLLPCKTYAFGTQNNRFCNALTASKLYNRYAYEKPLHYYSFNLALLFQNRKNFCRWRTQQF